MSTRCDPVADGRNGVPDPWESDEWIHTRKRQFSRDVCADVTVEKHTCEMFTLTLPLVASTWLVSACASRVLDGHGQQKLMTFEFHVSLSLWRLEPSDLRWSS